MTHQTIVEDEAETEDHKDKPHAIKKVDERITSNMDADIKGGTPVPYSSFYQKDQKKDKKTRVEVPLKGFNYNDIFMNNV